MKVATDVHPDVGPKLMHCCLRYRVWLSYLNPIFWTVYGLIESQVDNLDSLVALNNGESVPAFEAVEIIFGYQ